MERYYKRKIDSELESWATSKKRKPLLLRGARQVGKTSAVKHLGEKFKHFVLVDFNERQDVHYLFDGSYSPQEICRILSVLKRARHCCFLMRYSRVRLQSIASAISMRNFRNSI